MQWINRLTQYLDDLLVKVYAASSPLLRALFLSPLYTLRRAFLLVTRGLTFQVFTIEGKAQGSGQPLSVLYFSEGRGLAYLLAQLFEPETVDCRKIGKARAWQIRGTSKRYEHTADMIVVEQNTLLHWRPRSGAWASSPTWVRMALDIDARRPWPEFEKTFRKQERNLRRMKRSGFRYEISRDAVDFDLFYERMYVPYVRGRHSEFAHIDSKRHLFSLFQRGFLLFIVDPSGQRVAADLASIIGDIYFGVACGVLDNDAQVLEAGAVSALYYDALQWCHENGIRRSDIGEVRPFLHDGVYQYKRRWGYQPALELWNTREWLFWAPNGSPVALEWLAANPTIPEFTRHSAPEHFYITPAPNGPALGGPD